MNVNPLKKNLIKETIILGGIAFVLACGVMYASSVNDDLLQKKNAAESEVGSLISQRQTLESSFDAVQKNLEVYKEALVRIASPGMFIDRQAVRDIFNIYRSQFFFSKLSVEMQPVVEEKDDPKFARKTLVTVKSDVRIAFEASSDDEVYALIRILPSELAGYTKITKFVIQRMGKVDEKSLLGIRSKGSASLVSGSIDLTWYGMKSPDPNSELNKVVAVKPERRRRR